MIERTRGTRLALEALLGLTILRQRLGQKLQGNESLFRVESARRDLTWQPNADSSLRSE